MVGRSGALAGLFGGSGPFFFFFSFFGGREGFSSGSNDLSEAYTYPVPRLRASGRAVFGRAFDIRVFIWTA